MKTAVAAPVLFRSLVLSGAGLAADTDRLEKTLEEALGDEEWICAVVRTLDREISARLDDERLRNLRIAAYGSLPDPYSAGADVDFPAARHPDSPAFQLQECLYAEATGEAQSENRLCRLRVVECCRESGEDNAQSHEYLLALLPADAPEAEEARQQFLAALGDSPMEQCEGKSVPVCTRQPCQEIDATNGRHPCPRWQQPDEHEEK